MTAHARRTDPVTSSLAAASVTNLTLTKRRILKFLDTMGPMTRDQLIALWRSVHGEETTDQSIRSRLAELMRENRVITWGHTHNSRGRKVELVDIVRKPKTLF